MPTFKRTWNKYTNRMTNWDRTGYRTGYGTGFGGSKSMSTTSYSPTQFNTVKKQIQAKVASFKTINQQISGGTKVTAFSPTGAGKWINFINNGANVYKFTNTQFNKWFGPAWDCNTPTAATRFMKNKFGSCILAVTKGKGNTWLVAATTNVSGRPFKNYNWK